MDSGDKANTIGDQTQTPPIPSPNFITILITTNEPIVLLLFFTNLPFFHENISFLEFNKTKQGRKKNFAESERDAPSN